MLQRIILSALGAVILAVVLLVTYAALIDPKATPQLTTIPLVLSNDPAQK